MRSFAGISSRSRLQGVGEQCRTLRPKGFASSPMSAKRHGVSLDAAVALARGARAGKRTPGAIQPSRSRRHGAMVARRNDHGWRHVQSRPESPRRCALQRTRRSPAQPTLARCRGRPGLSRKARAAGASACSSPDPARAGNGGRRNSAVPPRPAPRTICDTPSSLARVVSRSNRAARSASTTPASTGSPASPSSRAAISR